MALRESARGEGGVISEAVWQGASGRCRAYCFKGTTNQLPLLQGDRAHTNFFYFSFKGTHTNYLYYSFKGTHSTEQLFPLFCNGASHTKLPLRLQEYNLFSSCCCCFSHYKFFCTTKIAYPPILILRKHKSTSTNSKSYINGILTFV